MNAKIIRQTNTKITAILQKQDSLKLEVTSEKVMFTSMIIYVNAAASFLNKPQPQRFYRLVIHQISSIY